MAEQTPLLHGILVVVLCFLAVAVLICMIRVVRARRWTDRLIAMNLVGSLVVLMICILSYVLGEGYLMDVAIMYGLLNLLAVAVLCRIVVSHHRERKESRKK